MELPQSQLPFEFDKMLQGTVKRQNENKRDPQSDPSQNRSGHLGLLCHFLLASISKWFRRPFPEDSSPTPSRLSQF